MSKINFLSLIKERIGLFFVFMNEGYRFKDKMLILWYHLKSPLQLLNYLRGVKNSRDLGGNVTIKNKYGVFFCGRNFSNLYGSCSTCEPVMRKYMNLKEGVAVDLGANSGMFTIPLARMLRDSGTVVSIEPDKKNVELLRKSVDLNNLRNVKIVRKGVFSKKKEMTFHIDDFGTGGHSLLRSELSGKKETIQVDTLDNILKDLKIGHVDLIKMDVMGVELEAFKGAEKTLKKSHPKIVFELLHKEDKDKVYNYLSQYGYKIKQITGWNHLAV